MREPAPEAPAARRPAPAPAPTPLWRDESAQLGHVHAEAPFDDYARQPLLPNRLSELGPGVTWYDVDRDGDEDLLLPAGRGGRLAYYRNTGGRLRRETLGLPATAYDQTTVLGLPGAAGGTVLVVGQASYEAAGVAEALGVAGVVRLGVGPDGRPRGPGTAVVPGDSGSVGPVAAADYDGDGDLDLFVGGRVRPGQYPAPVSSRLYRNAGGTFTLDTLNSAALAGVGLVAAALFADLDGDAAPELVLALEWGPLRVWHNVGGRFHEQTAAWGLAEATSRWNGVATGDLDGDGRLDLVATSWGRNTRYRPAPERPVVVYYGDVDHSGSWEVFEAQYDSALGALAPLARFEVVRRALPAVGRRVPSFAAYAEASLATVVGGELAGVPHRAMTTLAHRVWLNRGARFTPVALPEEAQWAPAFYAGVADFDGDGHEDVVLSQNFFPTEPETPRYDAGRGLWLRGDGTGRLEAVPGQVAGLEVYGDQRGAALADYDGDGRLDLVISQNGAATKLYHNQGAQPGLRVRLLGPPANPDAIGAQLRVVYATGPGPVREVQAGAGYWAHNGATQVLGLAQPPTALWVRWPDGTTQQVPLAPDTRTLTLPWTPAP